MDFLHPGLLAGSLLAVVPVILHLVMRQKPKRFEFPALRFIHQRRAANQRRLRLRHWVLLALRMAAIALLALALARPSVRAPGVPGAVHGPVAAALVFDTAPRMGYRHENKTRLEQAQEIASGLLNDLPPESQVAILDTRGHPGVFQIDLAAAQDRVRRLELSPRTQPMLEAMDEALRLLSSADRRRKEIYLFTDMSAAAWSSDASPQLRKQLDALADLGVYIVDVSIGSPQNCGLGELRLSSPVISQTTRLLVSTDVACRGAGGQRDVVLEMLDRDGKPQKRNQATVEVAEGQPGRVEFAMTGLPRGAHQGQVRLLGADGLASDDVRYFSVEVQPPWRVLIASRRPTETNAAYLAEALAPEQFRKQGLSRFECQVVDFGTLEGSNLSTYTAVFLLDPPAMRPAVWQHLTDFGQNGGGIGVFLGEHAQPAEEFNQAVSGFFAIRLAQKRDGPTHLTLPKRDHPLLAKFKPLGDEVPWDAYPVYHYWQLGDLIEGVSPILHYTDGQPALVEQSLGPGRLLLMTTSISDPPDTKPRPWSRLLTGLRPWPFFMLVNEMALYLVGGSDSQLNYVVGQPASVRLRRGEQATNYLLSTPKNDQIRGTALGRKDLITVSTTDLPGHYRLRSGGENGIDRGFSVNLTTEATSLQRADPGELKRIFDKHPVQLVHNASDVRHVVGKGRLGNELYPLVMIAVVLALGMEQLAANRFYRKES
jgi:hypothetical protein